MTLLEGRPRASHIFPKEQHSHYVEPAWCSRRLFDVERFDGHIYDPACGFGTIVISALERGLHAAGSDIINRGWDSTLTPSDFLKWNRVHDNIISNPPYDELERFVTHMVACSRLKTVALLPLARIVASHWLKQLPLVRIWLLTPRPSMPPGAYIQAGGRVGKGRQEFCWAVFDKTDAGAATAPVMDWLHREPAPQPGAQP
jgi:hypothetical protein